MSDSVRVVLIRQLRRALWKKRLDEAEALLERLRELAPLEVTTRGLELELALARDRIEEARKLAEQLCRLFPTSSRIYYLAGQAAYRGRSYSRAKERFSESHRLHPHWRTRRWLGKTLTQLGDLERASVELEAVRECSPVVLLDIAWLRERQDDLNGALTACEAYLEQRADDPWANRQAVRLRARLQNPEELLEEIAGWLDLGEEIPPDLLPEVVDKLLGTGRLDEARELAMAPRATLRVAWVCYRHRAWDLAYELFLRHLSGHLSDYKLLNALETTARRIDRLDELAAAYRELAPDTRSLYGRLRRLEG